jgi:hypothetical protein
MPVPSTQLREIGLLQKRTCACKRCEQGNGAMAIHLNKRLRAAGYWPARWLPAVSVWFKMQRQHV